jgi:hypothetical protein
MDQQPKRPAQRGMDEQRIGSADRDDEVIRMHERIVREGEQARRQLQRMARGADSDDPADAAAGRFAMRALARGRERQLDTYERMIRWSVQAARGGVPDITPELACELRAGQRDSLLRQGLLTESELDAFPEASLQEIAVSRFRRWRETGDVSG